MAFSSGAAGTMPIAATARIGQFCIVLPEQDAVIAITASTGDMQAELNLVWDKLLPAFQPAPLPANPDEEAKLKQVEANLAVPATHVDLVLYPPGSKARK